MAADFFERRVSRTRVKQQQEETGGGLGEVDGTLVGTRRAALRATSSSKWRH